VRITFLKLSIVLFIFFLVDFLKPFGFYFCSELLFLGILFVSVNIPFPYSLGFALVFGLFKDLLSSQSLLSNTFIFILINIFFTLAFKYFHGRNIIKNIAVGLAIISYALLNSIEMEQIPFFLIFLFFMQSLFTFFIMERFLFKWVAD